MPKEPKAATTRKKKNTSVPDVSRKPPNIEWAKHPEWTWSLITYLTDHSIFRTKLFSDSMADAAREGHTKAQAKEGKSFQYGTLAKHIFENDVVEANGYRAKPGRYISSVETRLCRLKEEYRKHLRTLGATGAGLAPEDVTNGSEMANLVASITSEWPWWKELHSFWRELPNYNPICVTTSTPGVDHTGQAAAAFNPAAISGGDEESVPVPNGKAGIGGEDDEHEQEDEERDEVEVANQEADAEADEPLSGWERTPSPPPAIGVAPRSKSVCPNPKPTIAKPAVISGRDAGLAKGQATNINKTSKFGQQKTALDKFNNYRSSESARLAEKQKMDHELRMATAQNKRLKYEFKMKSRAAEHNAQLELLRLQIQLAQANATSAAATATTPTIIPETRASAMDLTHSEFFNTPTASTSTIVPATPVPAYRLPLQSYNIPQTPNLSSDDGFFGAGLGGYRSKTATSNKLWVIGSDENTNYSTSTSNGLWAIGSDENTDYSSMTL